MQPDLAETHASAAPLYPPTIEPPGRDLPFLVNLARLVSNPLRVLPDAVYTDPIVPYSFLSTHLYWVVSPALVEQVLLDEADRFEKSPLERRVLGPTLGNGMLTSSGDTWRWQRRVAAPLFRHQSLLAYVPAMVAASETQVTRWAAEATPGSRFRADAEQAMMTVTFDIIASTLLAGCRPDEAARIKEADTAYMTPISWEMAAAVVNLPEWFPHPAKRRMRNAARTLRETVFSIMERRRRELAEAADPPDDILARLLAARDAETGKPMPDTMMVDNLTTFLEAGHQTTAQALSWTLYLLARAPEWQERLRREAFAVAGHGPLDSGHIAALPTTLRVFKEAMRLYPPVPAIVRVAAAPARLGGEDVPKGALIIIPVYALQRHRALWDDPDRFDPDRFLPASENGRPRGQYIPFGFGQRTCMGMPFAYIEGLAILATLLRRFRFHWDGRHEPEPISQITLHPKGGMPLEVEVL